MPKLAKNLGIAGSALYVEVEVLPDIAGKLDGLEIVAPKRTTSYGMTEIVICEPGGHWITFAANTPGKPEEKKN